MQRLSRWGTEPNGVKIIFTPADLQLCKLLAPTPARSPWSYQYLPTSYIGPLLERSQASAAQRVHALKRKPYYYFRLPEQPLNNYRDLIYQIGPAGLEELKKDGLVIPNAKHRRMPHELLASLIAASFEYGARIHALPIDAIYNNRTDMTPDWSILPLRRRSGVGGQHHQAVLLLLRSGQGRRHHRPDRPHPRPDPTGRRGVDCRADRDRARTPRTHRCQAAPSLAEG